jgi:hypothetical protein
LIERFFQQRVVLARERHLSELNASGERIRIRFAPDAAAARHCFGIFGQRLAGTAEKQRAAQPESGAEHSAARMADGGGRRHARFIRVATTLVSPKAANGATGAPLRRARNALR